MKRAVSLAVLLSTATAFPGGRAQAQIRFSMDPASPSNLPLSPPAAPHSLPPDPHDVVAPGLGVTWHGAAGVDVDAISPWVETWFPNPCDWIAVNGSIVYTAFWWSVDRAATGPASVPLPCPLIPPCIQVGDPVLDESIKGEAAGDIFLNIADPKNPCIRVRILLVDEAALGEVGVPPGPPIDEMNALSMAGNPVFYSVTAATAALLGVSGATILYNPVGSGLAGTPVFGPGSTGPSLGLAAGDDIDALAMGPMGILFSLAPGSPSLGAVGGSPGDVFWNDISILYAPAAFFDLLPWENLDGLHAEIKDPPFSPPGVPCGVPLPPVPYEVVPIPRNATVASWFSISSHPSAVTVLPGCSDDEVATSNLPFPFKYCGVPLTQANVSANGFLTFGSPGTQGWNNQVPGDPSLPNFMVAPFWDDLSFRPAPVLPGAPSEGKLLVLDVGSPGSRQRIYEWHCVGLWSPLPICPSGNGADGVMSFQVVLREGSDEIEIRYLDEMPGLSLPSATIGIENGAGLGLDLTGLGPANPYFPQTGFLLQPVLPAGTGLSYGTGCAASSGSAPFLLMTGGVPASGNPGFEITVTNSPANSIAILVLGLGTQNVDLGPLGFPGCTLLAEQLVTRVKQTTGSGVGTAEFALPIPNLPPGPYWLHAQCAVLSLAPFDFSMTEGLEITIG